MIALDSKRQCGIDLVKIILTIGIVCRHATWENLDAGLSIFQGFSKGIIYITEVCVPLFFVISGFLFFLNVPDKPDVKYFAGKYKKRFWSLLIPYIIANCVAFAVYFAAHRYAPQMISGFMGEDWKNPIYVFWTGPINLSLWFIRELIVAVIISPLIYLIVRYTRLVGVVILGLLMIFWKLPAPWFYFAAGAWFSICGGVVGIKDLDPQISKKRINFYKNSRSWCFFVYLYHYIPLIALKKVLLGLAEPLSELKMFVIYFAGVIIVLAAISLAYVLLRKFTPGLLKVLAGGR